MPQVSLKKKVLILLPEMVLQCGCVILSPPTGGYADKARDLHSHSAQVA
jgi:hypothetical protein